LKLQKAGKKRPECFLPSSKEEVQPTIINGDTPLEEDKYVKA
jgi:hypothetical protein